jgi:cyclophilin family peptidyl-prolyl cis-trans isomerase/HEAT repeat protein
MKHKDKETPSVMTSVPLRGLRLLLAAVVAVSAACVPTPVATPAPPAPAAAPVVPLDRKAAWILRLEDERVLRDGPTATPDAGLPATASSVPGAAASRFVPATTPDLLRLVTDVDPAIRRRAALAIGRVGDSAGGAALVVALADPDADVRASAAFALGLLGAKSAVAPLVAALKDPAPLVAGRAAEALGLIGDPAAAPAIAAMAAGCRTSIAGLDPDDEREPQAPEVAQCQLAIFSLVRLKNYDALSSVVLDGSGHPISRWWPVAFALQRLGDTRAVPALVWLASSTGVNTPAFALKGLGALHDNQGAPMARAIAARRDADVRLRVAAVKMLGQIADKASAAALTALVSDRTTPLNLAVEAAASLGAVGQGDAFEVLVDQFSHTSPVMRAAALSAAAALDPDAFLMIVSSLPEDREWSVRAAYAHILAFLPADRVRAAVGALAGDPDLRVRAAGLEALAKIGAPDLTAQLYSACESPDYALRATAATLVGDTHPADGVPHLVAAYERAKSDTADDARIAALTGLARYGGDESKRVLHDALGDRDWPVRLKAAALLRTDLGEAGAEPVRPAPLRHPVEFFESAPLLHAAYSPHAFIDTRYGAIEIELDVVLAPLTSMNFVELARAGFFSGMKIHRVVPNFVVQAGDPRGDGIGGPGYAIRDELSPQPFLRGTVGMALDGTDTGGSQFFISVSPQPYLDGKYTVFGRVVKGMEILDQISQGDVIDQVRIWDGVK